MKEADIAPLTYGDLLRYLGILLLMSTCFGWNMEGFWCANPFDKEAYPFPYFLWEFISKRRFNAIIREVRFTNTNLPPYVHKFWKNFQMVKAWNDHTTSIFLVSWEIFLDESMSICHR